VFSGVANLQYFVVLRTSRNWKDTLG